MFEKPFARIEIQKSGATIDAVRINFSVHPTLPIFAKALFQCAVVLTVVSPEPAMAFQEVEPLLVSRGQSAVIKAQRLSPPLPNESKKEHLARIFTPEVTKELWLEDYTDLDTACETGWLVDIADDPRGLGVSVRKSGSSPVGEKERNPELRAKLHRLARPAAGLLYSLAATLRAQEGGAFRPLEVTSLVRPWSYQRRLMHTNPNADVIKAGVPPTHVFGLAFDLARRDMSSRRHVLLERELEKLSAEGKIVYFKEGKAQSTFHVLALPAATQLFEAEFDRQITLASARYGTSPPIACEDIRDAMLMEDTVSW